MSGDEQQRRRAAAYDHAAAVHDQAARMHEDAAEFFDRCGRPGRAEYERGVARRERTGAADDRARACREETAGGE